MTPSAPPLVERILQELARRRRPRSSADLAREFLGVGIIDEELAERLLGPLLADDPRFTKSAAGWIAGPAPAPVVPLDAPALAVFAPKEPPLVATTALGGPGEPAFVVAAGGETEARRAAERLGTQLPGAVVDLARVCRRLRGYRGPASPLELAEGVRAPHVEAETPAACAAIVGAVWERLAGEFAAEGVPDLAALDRLLEQHLQRTEFEGKQFGPGDIEALPAGPGVYSFVDERGRSLYVGQSQCLAARVASYFVGPPRDEKDRVIRSAAVRLTVRGVDSAPDALIEEARWIRRRRPALNVRRAAHASERQQDEGILAVRGPGERGRLVFFVVRPGGLWVRFAAAPGPRRSRRAVDSAVSALFTAAPAQGLDLEGATLLATWRRTHSEALFVRPALDGAAEQIAERLLSFAGGPPGRIVHNP